MASTARPFAPGTIVTWRDGYQPTAAPDLSAPVFMSTRRETVLLVEGRPRTFATVALVRA